MGLDLEKYLENKQKMDLLMELRLYNEINRQVYQTTKSTLESCKKLLETKNGISGETYFEKYNSCQKQAESRLNEVAETKALALNSLEDIKVL